VKFCPNLIVNLLDYIADVFNCILNIDLLIAKFNILVRKLDGVGQGALFLNRHIAYLNIGNHYYVIRLVVLKTDSSCSAFFYVK